MPEITVNTDTLKTYWEAKKQVDYFRDSLEVAEEVKHKAFQKLPEELKELLAEHSLPPNAARPAGTLLTEEQLLDAAKVYIREHKDCVRKQMSRHLKDMPNAGSTPRVSGYIKAWLEADKPQIKEDKKTGKMSVAA